jgi:penicillin-binding protein 1A
MRGNYWGQGGHNALRLVGSFFQQGQKAGLIDTQAVFPQVVPDAPMVLEQGPAVDAPADMPGTPASASPSLFPSLRVTPPTAEAAAERQMQDQARGR